MIQHKSIHYVWNLWNFEWKILDISIICVRQFMIQLTLIANVNIYKNYTWHMYWDSFLKEIQYRDQNIWVLIYSSHDWNYNTTEKITETCVIEFEEERKAGGPHACHYNWNQILHYPQLSTGEWNDINSFNKYLHNVTRIQSRSLHVQSPMWQFPPVILSLTLPETSSAGKAIAFTSPIMR